MLPEDGLEPKHVVTNKIIRNTQGCVVFIFIYKYNIFNRQVPTTFSNIASEVML